MTEVLYILDYHPQGGRTFDDFLLALIQAVNKRGMRIRFVFSNEPSRAFLESIKTVDCPFEWMVLPFPLTYGFWRHIDARWPGYQPDVLYTSFLSVFTWPLVFARIRRCFKRWVVSDESSGDAKAGGWVKESIRWVRGKIIGQVVDKVRTVSHYIEVRDVQDMYLPAAKVKTVWNGIDLERYPFSNMSFQHDSLQILYIGQLIPEKGVDVLINALADLKNTQIPFACRIAGSGVDREQLEQKSRNLGLEPSVQFLGFCSNPIEQYQWADIVVVPSRWAEAFGLVAIEAMACGCVVIVSDKGGLPEVVDEAGFVFPSGDASRLGEVLKHLISSADECKIYAIKGRNRVEECFQLENTVNKIISLLG